MKYEPDEVQEEREIDGRFFQLRWRYCGRKNCGRCPHGPYWFELSQRKDGGWKSWYVGKELEKAFRHQTPKNPRGKRRGK